MTTNCASSGSVTENMKDYYGKRLTKSSDLFLTCPKPKAKIRKEVQDAMKDVHQDVSNRYFGCGLVIPEVLERMRILDLGCGSGRDCYVLSKLVGEKGHVTGIDMTEEMLKVSRDYINYHTEKFGYKEPNVEFKQGYIERLGEAGLKDDTFDIIVSNCVIDLSPDKESVFSEAYRVLKPGGELFFSDIYADRKLPPEVAQDKVLWGEGLGGALVWQELYTLAEQIGFSKPRLVRSSVYKVDKVRHLVGEGNYISGTYRLFKLPAEKKPACQVIYRGKIPGHEDTLKFDHRVTFKANEVYTADQELSNILQNSRYSDQFEFRPLEPGSDVQDSGTKPDPFVYANMS